MFLCVPCPQQSLSLPCTTYKKVDAVYDKAQVEDSNHSMSRILRQVLYHMGQKGIKRRKARICIPERLKILFGFNGLFYDGHYHLDNQF